MRTAVFIDGYNVFYGLLAGTPYKWLNLSLLLTHICRVQDPTAIIETVNYYTSSVIPHLATRGIESRHAQDTYIRALKTTGINIFTGRHRLEHARAPRFISKSVPASRLDKVDIWELDTRSPIKSLMHASFLFGLRRIRNLRLNPNIGSHHVLLT